MEFQLDALVRSNVKALKPYSSARDEYEGEASVFLDANENPYNHPYNRYPDPMQWAVKEKIAAIKGVKRDQILLGNGSDEPIDLLFRAFCEPAIDNVVAIDPSYGMYLVCAEVNNVAYRKVQLNENFDISATSLLAATDSHTKLIFLCSPNNPTGNSLAVAEIEQLLTSFAGIVVVDEAYIDFSSHPSWLSQLATYPNLVVLQTLSKAWGCAAIRLGMCFAHPAIVAVLNKIKYPYNINQLTQEKALEMLDNRAQVQAWVAELNQERAKMQQLLASLPTVEHIYPSDANFLLVRITHATAIYNQLVAQGIIVRNRSTVTLCGDCLRITIGTPQENQTLYQALLTLVSTK